MDSLTLHMTLKTVSFRDDLQKHIREKAERAENTLGAAMPRHRAALLTLAEYVATTGPEDQRMFVLNALAQARGDKNDWGETCFSPTHQQEVLLSRLGAALPPPPASTTLDEMVTGSVLDFIDDFRKAEARTGGLANDLDETRASLKTGAEKNANLVADLDQTRQKLGDVEAERNQLDRTVTELRSYLKAAEQNSPSESNGNGGDSSRRVKVEGETGVYYSDTADGRVFEIGYRDDEGKQRWKRVGHSLQEAVELRAELAGKPFKEGEAEEDSGSPDSSAESAEKETVAV